MTCFDLNLHWPIISDFRNFGGESVYARRQVGVLAVDGVPSVAAVRYVRPSLRRRSQGQNVSLQRTSAGSSWKPVLGISRTNIWEVRKALKRRLATAIYAETGISLNEDVCTIVWARRFASYKRPDVLFADMDALRKLLTNSKQPLQVIVAGKSHPNDGYGKELLEVASDIAANQPGHTIIFLENYRLSLAELLTQGADIWLNTPIYGKEASGTSGMKAAMNGVLQCTVADGWAAEVNWKDRGFLLEPKHPEESLYKLLESTILPLYYQRKNGVPVAWTEHILKSIAEITPRFSAHRMLAEYEVFV